MTDKYTQYGKRQTMPQSGIGTTVPLSEKEKADLKMRILFALKSDAYDKNKIYITTLYQLSFFRIQT